MVNHSNGDGRPSHVVDLDEMRKKKQQRAGASAHSKSGGSGSKLRFTDYLKFFGLLFIMSMMMHYCQRGS